METVLEILSTETAEMERLKSKEDDEEAEQRKKRGFNRRLLIGGEKERKDLVDGFGNISVSIGRFQERALQMNVRRRLIFYLRSALCHSEDLLSMQDDFLKTAATQDSSTRDERMLPDLVKFRRRWHSSPRTKTTSWDTIYNCSVCGKPKKPFTRRY